VACTLEVLNAPSDACSPISRHHGLPAEFDKRRVRPALNLAVSPGFVVGPEPRAPQTLVATFSMQRLSLPLSGPFRVLSR
jgi:hypothetical protein